MLLLDSSLVVVDSWPGALSCEDVWWTGKFAGPRLHVVWRNAGGALAEPHPEEERCR